MDDATIALISGARYNARGCDVRLEVLGSKDSVCVGMDDRLPLRSAEQRVDFPSAMPYTDFMERFHQAYVDELVAFTDLVAGADRDAVLGIGGAPGVSCRRDMRHLAASGPSGADGGGGPVMTIADRLAGAPISWGVCEVPGWGWQLDSATVLAQMQAAGLVATEFGPDGFLPDDSLEKAKTLAEWGLSAVGGFVPVVLHDPAVDPVRQIHRVLAGFKAVGAATLVLAAVTRTDGYDVRPELDDDGWQVLLDNLDRLALFAGRMGIIATVHPHVGTMVETAGDVERVRVGSGIGLCLATGHLLIGGADPVALAAEHAGGIRHTHLKDVDATWARRVRSGAVTYTEAVRGGMYRPLGQGDVDIASIVGSLERAGYGGRYVLEQDTTLARPWQGGPAQAGRQAPRDDVRVSIDHLFAVAEGTLLNARVPTLDAAFDVLTIGRVGVDLYPLQSGTHLQDVETFAKFPGGSPTNVAVAAARHGRRSAVITCTGCDPFGTFIHQALRSLGVDDRFVSGVDGLPTPITFGEVFPPDDFPLCFYRYPAAPDLHIQAAEIDLEAVGSASIYWSTVTGLSAESSRSAHFAAWDGPGRAPLTVLDLDYRPMFWDDPGEAHVQVDRALSMVTVAVGNSAECQVAVGESDPDRAVAALLDKGIELAVVKQGPKGVLARTRDERAEVAAFLIEEVNGLGAGDAFGGALCHGLLAGWSLERVLRFANVAGAIVASRLQCSTAMPTDREVEERMGDQQTPNNEETAADHVAAELVHGGAS
jgi:5-dehydro-2-deoxygluconokinase